MFVLVRGMVFVVPTMVICLGWIKVPDKVHAKRCALRHGCMAGFVLVFPSAGMGAKLIGAMTSFGMTMNRCYVVPVCWCRGRCCLYAGGGDA